MYRMEVIDANGRPTGVLKPPPHVPRRGGNLQPNILGFPFDVVRMATSGNAFSADVLRRVSPIPEDVYNPSGVDWYLCPIVGLFGQSAFLEEIGAGYRLHGDNRNWYERPEMKLDLRAIRKDLYFMRTGIGII
jgi:hypothetical protein